MSKNSVFCYLSDIVRDLRKMDSVGGYWGQRPLGVDH